VQQSVEAGTLVKALEHNAPKPESPKKLKAPKKAEAALEAKPMASKPKSA